MRSGIMLDLHLVLGLFFHSSCVLILNPLLQTGFEKPSAIQQRGIVPFTQGLDVIQQAQSGTGKTATFCSGILQQLDYSLLECQALVLAPTRELAQQIEKVMRALGDYLQVKVHACVGGTSVREDQRILQSGVHVVVGTPGRVYDMLRRNALRADAIKCFVLDEADEMLSRGFKDQVCVPLSLSLDLPFVRQSTLGGSNEQLKTGEFSPVWCLKQEIVVLCLANLIGGTVYVGYVCSNCWVIDYSFSKCGIKGCLSVT